MDRSQTTWSAEEGTAEAWALDFLLTTSLEAKLDPPPIPARFESPSVPRRVTSPGRPAELVVSPTSKQAPRPAGLREPHARARLLATLHHHELQAAELFAWAALSFPETPLRFREGLLALAREELDHARAYRGRLRAAGADLADFPVRDWFWERVPSCESAASFVAVMGLGLEGGNLEHASRYAQAFAAGGDPETAEVCRRVAQEERAHVRFGAHWFVQFTGRLDFEEWRAHLPKPLTPTLFQGRPLDREARLAAGMDEAFLDALESFECP